MRRMRFDHSDKAIDLQRRLTVFMDQYVYPNEATYYEQHASFDDFGGDGGDEGDWA